MREADSDKLYSVAFEQLVDPVQPKDRVATAGSPNPTNEKTASKAKFVRRRRRV